ncbi:uncharacterized protein [Periplaneta americana]|uniref:uncharacterized protein isoform X2 n=1 Tax=Periplaneta americana TaxID=6978 RepID=UPI0037E7D3DD
MWLVYCIVVCVAFYSANNLPQWPLGHIGVENDPSELKSFTKPHRIQSLGDAILQWIFYVPDGLQVGMVTFSTEEELLSGLTTVDDTTRHQLIQSIPTTGQGETCIGCGVRLALQVLSGMNGVIVLVTDGQNTEPSQFISDIEDEVVSAGSKVVAVGFGNSAPLNDLEKLAKATGGLFFSVSDEDGVEGLLTALNATLELTQEMEISPIYNTYEVSEKWTSSEEMVTIPFTIKENNSEIATTESWQTLGKKIMTSSQSPPVRLHKFMSSWLIVGISFAIAVGLLLLTIVMLLVWRKLRIAPITGFYPVSQSEACVQN